MMKRVIRFMLSIYITLYRLTSGRFGGEVQGLRVLLLTTVGRKTHKMRTAPLGYFMDGDRYVVIASNAGSNIHPAWFHNLREKPHVEGEIGRRTLQANAEIVDAVRRKSLWAILVKLAPGYATYERKTTREIPLVALRPLTNQ